MLFFQISFGTAHIPYLLCHFPKFSAPKITRVGAPAAWPANIYLKTKDLMDSSPGVPIAPKLSFASMYGIVTRILKTEARVWRTLCLLCTGIWDSIPIYVPLWKL